jgi:hypothetical protein
VIGLTTFEKLQIGTGKNEIDISLENGPIKCGGYRGILFVVIKSDSLHHDGEVGEASEELVTSYDKFWVLVTNLHDSFVYSFCPLRMQMLLCLQSCGQNYD